jgi:hypothetical protein
MKKEKREAVERKVIVLAYRATNALKNHRQRNGVRAVDVGAIYELKVMDADMIKRDRR